MKILDFELKGNVIKFYLGNCNDWWGDDWDDRPYEHNAGKVYDQYGVTLNHTGYVYETDSTYAHSNYPNIFMPQISSSNDITSSMYSDGKVTISWRELFSGLPRIIMAIFLGI